MTQPAIILPFGVQGPPGATGPAGPAGGSTKAEQAIAISPGVNNVSVSGFVCAVLGIAGAAYSIASITGGTANQELTLLITDTNPCTLSNLSVSGTLGGRIMTPNAADLPITAPVSGGYRAIQLRYRTAADSGNGGWVVISS